MAGAKTKAAVLLVLCLLLGTTGWFIIAGDGEETRSREAIDASNFRLDLGPSLRGQDSRPPGVGTGSPAIESVAGKPTVASITGTVEDSSGRPVAHASVSRLEEAGGGFRAVTDADGAFQIDGLELGRFKLSFGAVGYSWLTVEAEAPGQLTVVLDRLRSVQFELRLETDDPIPAHVRLTAVALDGGSSPVLTVSRLDGKFLATGIPVGKVEFRLDAPSYPTRSIRRTVEPGELVDLGLIDLRRGTMISGRLEDRRGEPVFALPVRIDGTRLSVSTTRDGGFTIGPVSGDFVTLRVVGGVRYLSSTQVVDAREGATPIVIQVDKGSLVSGTVSRADGSPEPADERMALYLLDTGKSPRTEETIDRDPKGLFVFRERPGRYRLELRDPTTKAVGVGRDLVLEEGVDQKLSLRLPAR